MTSTPAPSFPELQQRRLLVGRLTRACSASPTPAIHHSRIYCREADPSSFRRSTSGTLDSAHRSLSAASPSCRCPFPRSRLHRPIASTWPHHRPGHITILASWDSTPQIGVTVGPIFSLGSTIDPFSLRCWVINVTVLPFKRRLCEILPFYRVAEFVYVTHLTLKSPSPDSCITCLIQLCTAAPCPLPSGPVSPGGGARKTNQDFSSSCHGRR